MQKNIQKKLIMLLVTAAFVMTIVGAASAATIDTDLELDDDLDPIHVGDAVTLTADLEADPSSGPNYNLPGETINFYDVTSGTTFLGSSVTDSNGIATFIYTPLTSGDKTYRANYAGRADPAGPADGYDSSYDFEDLEVRTAPSLTVTKSDNPDPVNPGSTLTYTMTITNTGASRVYNVRISDTVPTALTNVQYSLNNINWFPYTSGTLIGLLNMNGGATQNFYVRGTVNPATPAGTITNTATVYTCNTPRAQDTETTTVTGPQLAITKYPDRSPANYNVGENVVFTIFTQNVGTGTANNVVVTDTVPAGFSIVDADGGNVVGNTITWNIGNLAAGASDTILLTLGVMDGYQGQTLTNSVQAGCTQTGPVNAQSSIHVNNAVLTVDKYPDRSPSNYNVGEDVVYTITLRNTGPDAATGVVLTDTLPAGLTFVSATNGGTESGGVITWNIGNLAVDGEFTALVTARVNSGTQGQTLTNTVSAVNTQNPTPVTDTSDIYVNSAPLTITKTADKAQYNVGETVTYTINVTNNAVANGVPGDATGVVVTDTLPAGLTFVSASNGGVWDANTRTITWNVGNLAAGASFTPTVTATVTGEAAAKNLVNTATADSDQLDDPVTATASIYVPSADLVLTKTVDKTNPTVKDTVIFTLIVNNNGPDTAVDVTVNDKLPAGLTYVSHTANFGTYDPATGLWTISSLPNGASAVLTITAVVEQSGQIVNQANVTALTWDPNLDDNAASAAMNVQAEPVPVSGKTVDMEKTGAPIFGLLLAFFMLVAGLVLPRRKN